MSEKKTELKLAVGSLGTILTVALASIVAAVQTLLDTGVLEDRPAWSAIALAIIAAGTALGAGKVSSDYSRSRAAVKVAKAQGVLGTLNPTQADVE